jgi:thiol-disulfide isomerase/thioredoxin
MSARRVAAFLLAAPLVVVLTGCAGASDASGRAATSSPPAPSSRATPGSSEPASAAPPPEGSAPPLVPTEPAGAILTQPWATATLTDVRSGQPFRIADLVAGNRVVFLETMAIWCTKCRAQQEEAVAALRRLDPATVAWVAIDVESSESADALARYSEQHGFDFAYAVADRELARALVESFGDTILNPPSVNVVVIGTDGRVTAGRGHKSADEIVALAAEHGA